MSGVAREAVHQASSTESVPFSASTRGIVAHNNANAAAGSVSMACSTCLRSAFKGMVWAGALATVAQDGGKSIAYDSLARTPRLKVNIVCASTLMVGPRHQSR